MPKRRRFAHVQSGGNPGNRGPVASSQLDRYFYFPGRASCSHGLKNITPIVPSVDYVVQRILKLDPKFPCHTAFCPQHGSARNQICIPRPDPFGFDFMNSSTGGFSRVVVFVAVAVIVLLAAMCARNLRLGPLLKERRVVSNAELIRNGARVEVLENGSDPTHAQIRVTVSDSALPYAFTATSLFVTDQEINKDGLTRMLAENALPVFVRDEASREHVSSFVATRAELEKSFVTVLYHRGDKLRFWGSDVREYLMPVSDGTRLRGAVP